MNMDLKLLLQENPTNSKKATKHTARELVPLVTTAASEFAKNHRIHSYRTKISRTQVKYFWATPRILILSKYLLPINFKCTYILTTIYLFIPEPDKEIK